MDENSPVLPAERVFRRILKAYYDASLAQPIQRVSFVPNKSDDDGLSLFREAFTSAAEVAAKGPNAKGYVVARLLVQDIVGLGLSVVPAPDETQPRGHCLIPELTIEFHKTGKNKAKELEQSLAELAGRDVIYVEPPRDAGRIG